MRISIILLPLQTLIGTHPQQGRSGCSILIIPSLERNIFGGLFVALGLGFIQEVTTIVLRVTRLAIKRTKVMVPGITITSL